MLNNKKQSKNNLNNLDDSQEYGAPKDLADRVDRMMDVHYASEEPNKTANEIVEEPIKTSANIINLEATKIPPTQDQPIKITINKTVDQSLPVVVHRKRAGNNLKTDYLKADEFDDPITAQIVDQIDESEVPKSSKLAEDQAKPKSQLLVKHKKRHFWRYLIVFIIIVILAFVIAFFNNSYNLF